MAVTLGFSEASVTGWEGGFGIRVGGVVDLTTRPLERRDSTPHPDPSDRQWAWPAVLSERYDGLWRRSFGHGRAPALQARPSPLSTLYSPGSSLCAFARSHSTGAVPTGQSNHRRGGSPHTRRTAVRKRSFAAYVQSAGSACIAIGLSGPRTIPPTLASRRFR